jgi:type VI secretion system protein ImpC
MAQSSQKFIARDRAARVQIEYDVELYGAEKHVQLPFVMGLLVDLSGRSEEKVSAVADRKFLDIDIDNFESRMAAIRPRVVFAVPNTVLGQGDLAVDITFDSMDDFAPAAVARKVDVLAELLTARQQLVNLMSYMDGKSGAEELISKVLRDRGAALRLMTTAVRAEERQTQRGGFEGVLVDGEDFSRLLEKEFRPRTQDAKVALEAAVHTLIRETLEQQGLVQADVAKSIGGIVAALDHKLSRQLNMIMHHEDFRKLEGAWRGLYYFVNNTETDEMLKVRFMDISKAEVGKTLRRYKGTTWEQSPLFKRIYEEEYGQFGGEPFGCLVGDYYFDHGPPDVELLGEMAKICATAHTPFIAGASLSLLNLASWQELSGVRRTMANKSVTPEYAAWRGLRESDESRYIGLAVPRFLARPPYGAATNPVDDFDFEEEAGDGDHGKYAWCNSAYAMAVSIARAFKLYGWCARICGVESGGAVEGLPTDRFPTDDGGFDTKCPVEIAISDRREAELAASGLMPLVHRKNSDFAAFIGACSLHRPFEYDAPEATANAILAARLPYLFACCRFAQYLKCMVRDRIGSFKARDDMERWLQQWIVRRPIHHSSKRSARKPPAAGCRWRVEAIPSCYTARLYLRPDYQLENTAHAHVRAAVGEGSVAGCMAIRRVYLLRGRRRAGRGCCASA